jgi:hypothetical protein
MTLNYESFADAFNRYAPPATGEAWLSEVLRRNGFVFEDVERAELLYYFPGPTSEINSHMISDKGSELLRHGQGMNEFVVLAGKEPELVALLRDRGP